MIFRFCNKMYEAAKIRFQMDEEITFRLPRNFTR